MKRKKTTIILIGCILTVGIFLIFYMNENTIGIRKEWALSDEEISKVEMIGLSQNLNIIIKKSDEQGNRVIIEGNIPESFAEKIENLEPGKDSLSLNFVNLSGISIAKNVNESLEITICLEDEALMKELVVKSNKGDVNITIPKGYESGFLLSTGYGQIKAPEECMNVDRTIAVELGAGDITISVEEDETGSKPSFMNRLASL